MGVHTYTLSCFDQANTGAAGEGYPGQEWQEIIRYYSDRGSAIIHITEAAINTHQRDPVTHLDPTGYDVNKWVNYLAARYVMATFGFDATNTPSAIQVSSGEFLALFTATGGTFSARNFLQPTQNNGGTANGRVKGVMYFQTSYNSKGFDNIDDGTAANGYSDDPYYNIDQGSPNTYGGHQKIGNRDVVNSGCGR